MSQCPSCNFDNLIAGETCVQCGTVLPKPALDSSEDAAEKLRQIAEHISALTDEMQETLTPVRTTSFNGCGLMLLDYRPVGAGNYEATRWVTLFGFPIIPLSVWKLRPRRYTRDNQGERQSFNLLTKRRITLERCIRPYLFLALGAVPFVLAYYFLKPVIYYISRALGTGFAIALIIVLIALCLAWVGFIMTRFHNVEKAYKQNVM